MKRTVASLDLGTNTFRLLIAEASTELGLRPLVRRQRVTRLGEGFAAERRIRPAAIERALKVLESYRALLNEHAVTSVWAGGTSALRDASNRLEILSLVHDRLGIEIRVLGGEEEARLTLLGITWDMARRHSGFPHVWIAMDPGGGSTEYTAVEGGRVVSSRSLPLGSVSLSERFIHSDPPHPEELSAVHAAVVAELTPFYNSLVGQGWNAEGVELVGTSATVTALAAMDRDQEGIPLDALGGHRIPRERMSALLDRLCRISSPDRLRLPGIEPGREDVIVAGAALVLDSMGVLGAESLTVAVGGLLEGLLLDACGRTVPEAQNL